MVAGVHGITGVCVTRPVEEELRADTDIAITLHHSMMASPVLDRM